MTKFFKKSKKPYLGTILSPFSSNLCKMNFPEKRVLSVSRYSNYLPSCQKSVKDYRAISNKNAKLRDGQTDRWTDRQQWFSRTRHRTGVQYTGSSEFTSIRVVLGWYDWLFKDTYFTHPLDFGMSTTQTNDPPKRNNIINRF